MRKQTDFSPVQDYRKFTRDLKAQLKAVRVLEKQFFEIDDLCEWAIREDVTVLNDAGVRVSVVDDCLGNEQSEIYQKLCKAVADLNVMLLEGRSCFNNNVKEEG